MTSELCKAGVAMEHQAAVENGEKTERPADGGPVMERVVTAKLPTKYGNFLIHGFVNRINGEHHVALTMGDVADGEPVLVRVHS